MFVKASAAMRMPFYPIAVSAIARTVLKMNSTYFLAIQPKIPVRTGDIHFRHRANFLMEEIPIILADFRPVSFSLSWATTPGKISVAPAAKSDISRETSI